MNTKQGTAAVQEGDALRTLPTNRGDIEAAVRRRFAQGFPEPVMLREYDLCAQ